MENSQENDKERKRRERVENARVGYQVAASLEANEVRALWSRFSAMLTANSIIIGVIGWSLQSAITAQKENDSSPSLIAISIAMSLFGLFLCVAWYLLIARKQKYCRYLMLSARELEKHLYPVQTLDRGARLVGETFFMKGSEPCPIRCRPKRVCTKAGDRIIPVELDRLEKYKTNTVSRIVIFGFGTLHVLLFAYSFWLGFGPVYALLFFIVLLAIVFIGVGLLYLIAR